MCGCKHILNQYACISIWSFYCNVDWHDVNVIVLILQAKNVRLQIRGGGGFKSLTSPTASQKSLKRCNKTTTTTKKTLHNFWF